MKHSLAGTLQAEEGFDLQVCMRVPIAHPCQLAGRVIDGAWTNGRRGRKGRFVT